MNKKQLSRVFKETSLYGLMMFLLWACAASRPHKIERPTDPTGKPRVSVSSLEKQIHELINKERRKNGLSSLEWNKSLAAIARSHSKDMAVRNFFSHQSPEGHDFLYRYKHAGYSCGIHVQRTIYLGAENIAQNNLYDSITTINGKAFYDWNSQEKIAETTVRGWMNSSGHRKNILTPYFKSEGLGVVVAPDNKVYITQNFC